MKFNIEIDVTPEELRRFLGLPDVAPFQEELINKLRERIDAGVTGYDPATLMEPLLTGNLKSFEAMQKLFWSAMNNRNENGKE